tara:strand:- start:9631 stop:9909 length:279 start_codon:yes stop_codon:yes gene_type:complete
LINQFSSNESERIEFPKKEEDWSSDILSLETFFASASFPPQPVKVDLGSTVTNLPLFIASHLSIVKANNGKDSFKPYLNRLETVRIQLTELI